MCKKDDEVMVDVPLDDGGSKGDAPRPKNESDTSLSDDELHGADDTNGLCCLKKSKKNRPKSGADLNVWESSLEDRASCVSRWLLNYLTPMLQLGSEKVLEQSDMGVPSKEDEADRAYQVTKEAFEVQSAKARAVNEKRKADYEAKLARCATDEQRKKVKPPKHKDPNIAVALVKGFGVWKLVVGTIYYIISALLTFVPVLILNDLVGFFETGRSRYGVNPWVEVAGLAVIPFLVSLLQTRHQTIFAHCAVFVRTAVSTLLYRKALRVSAAARAQTSTGQVVNMMSNDTAQLQRFLQFAGMCLVAPIQIVLALVLIYQQVGQATWVGVGYMILLAPVNAWVFTVVSKQRRKVLKFSDLRVKMMNEILSGIRIIKFYAWERPFGKEVSGLRGEELEALTKLAYTSAWGFSLILMSAPLIQPILVFLTYVEIQNEPLSAATAFTTVALFNIMRFPFAFLPMGLLQWIQSKISVRRLERYLDLPELSEYVGSDYPGAEIGSITINNGHFSWTNPDAEPIRPVNKEKKEKRSSSRRRSTASKKTTDTSEVAMRVSLHSSGASSATSEATSSPPITLQDITCHIEAGSLVAVVGPVGCGKSSFLSAILGEMEPLQGSKVYVPHPEGAAPGFVSYCAQSPWVVNDTVRGNILFGREFDKDRYDRVIEACALIDDLAIFPAGDATEIGERGITASGGQKARISLARALYSLDTKILLMDDPLSAVDAHVGEHIFANAIAGEISEGLTRVLVTHHVHLLSRCDTVIVLEDGRIKHRGKYEDLVAQGVDFAGAIDVSRVTAKEEPAEEVEAVVEPEKKAIVTKAKEEEVVSDAKKAAMRKSGEKLMKDEEREEGSVAGSAYSLYAKAGGIWIAIGILVVQGIGRACEVMAGFWLAFWADAGTEAAINGQVLSPQETNFYVGIYALFGLVGVAGLTGRALLVAMHRLRASKKLHDDLTDSILRAPVAFFDTTPIGRILNRFAADMDKIDLELTQSISQGVNTIFSVLGAVAAMVAATKGTFLVALIPISYIYYLVQKWFRKTSTELQRINSIMNSPIFADFSQTLSGTSTIRAFNEQERFFEHCKQSFNEMNPSYILVQLTNYWLALRLDVLGGFMGAFIGAVAVGTAPYNFIPAGWLGLALSYSIEVTNFLKHGVRMIATIEAQMNSVERVLYYTNNITPEAPEVIPENDPPAGEWPKDGEIEFQNASMRYRDGPLVLKDLSLTVKPGEKVGVCGRTGSGKSSLMISLFRISEIEDDGGKILIDGVDTRDIGTATLRLNLSIIPQDPVIFSNTVRYNLDPFKESSDEELWDVLKKVHMAEVVARLPGGLDELVAEHGESFSQGERQLLCIARSLLRNPKILVMDEATASIDNATDASIQEMIRENFKDATVLTIAHRLNTIMDSDRVLVLDGGRIAEFDSPKSLLQKEGGQFKAMVERSRNATSGSVSDAEE